MTLKTKSALVLGATGPAGLCLLRELMAVNQQAVLYARNPSKIPNDIASNNLFTVVKGEMTDRAALETAMSPCSTVLSLLGPSIENKNIESSIFADYYKDAIFPAMQKLGIWRIIALGTISISRLDDHFTMFQMMVRVFMRVFAGAIYSNMLNMVTAFENEGRDLDWTVFRIAVITGEADEVSRKRNRESCNVFAGNVGEKGWTTSILRASLAKWMVEHLESDQWIKCMRR